MIGSEVSLRLDQLLDRLNEMLRASGEPIEPAARAANIAACAKAAEEELGVRLPDDVLRSLGIADGFHFNGLFVLASKTRPITGDPDAGDIMGIVEDNLDYWDVYGRGWLVLGYDEAWAYAYDAASGQYLRYGRVERQPDRWYARYGEMLADALDWAYVDLSSVVGDGFKFSRPR